MAEYELHGGLLATEMVRLAISLAYLVSADPGILSIGKVHA